ncbi:ICOS ligand-like isoform X2 [Notolabrus celidotus]|uniref:ICOS ligand-like isoform X2 n=1 Tax=Notolabrus celidotus TaxID=1203425 RepID=UPI00148FA266|nr:ICOS ligand-like isoform X2 [Notolabrus celidotus]
MTHYDSIQSGASFKRKSYLDYLGVLCVHLGPQRGAMPGLGGLWPTGLLLCFLSVCVCLEEECVIGLVGRPVSLPCFYPQLLTSVNVSVEWRRDDEEVLRATWREDGDVEEWSVNRASISAEALLTGNVSLELPSVYPDHNTTNFSLFIISQENQSAALCSVCLRIAASFSFPQLQREEAVEGNQTSFSCSSTGGFPEPVVHWLIDNNSKPPESAVKTIITSIPNTLLYNITSNLTVNISKDSSVSCIIENPTMNKTQTSTSLGAGGSQVVSRASEAMWIFSTVLSVVVGVMVVVGVGYQIHLDRISKRKKKEFQYQQQHTNRGYKRRFPDKEETEVMKTETDV